MSAISFRNGINTWDRDVDIDFIYEYNADLEKRVTHVLIFVHDVNKSINIPWGVFDRYIKQETSAQYADLSGITIRVVEKGIRIEDDSGLDLLITKEQMRVIKNAAMELKKEEAPVIKRLKKESATSDESFNDVVLDFGG